MEKRDERLLLMAAGLSAMSFLVDLTLAARGITILPSAVAPYAVLAVLLSGFVWLRLRLRRLAEDERRADQLARQEGQDDKLFGNDGFEPFTVAKSLSQFERFIVPVFTPLLAIVQGLWAWRLYRAFEPVPDAGGAYLWVVAMLAGQAFLLFLLSRYLLGLARLEDSKLLRGPGVILGLASLASVLGAAGTAVSHTVYAPAETLVYWALAGYLALLAVEGILNFIGETYRPRAGDKLNTAYESRISGLFTDPASWVNSVAQALDYQFGFSVSDTWFYRFLQGALLPMVLFQLAVLYLLSSLVFIQPYEEGILERFGQPKEEGWLLEGGMHLKWPWPFETVRRFPSKRIQSFHIGISHTDEHADEHDGAPTGSGPEDIVIWSREHHGGQDAFLVASQAGADHGQETVPVNFLNVDIPVEYRIEDVMKYAYGHADAAAVVEQIADRTFSLEAASRDLFDIMTTRKLEIAHQLRDRIQEQTDDLGLGVEIMFIGLQGVHPPAAVVQAFESVIGAAEEKEATILKAQAEAGRILPLAKANAEATLKQAEAYRVRRKAASSAETDRFEQQLEAYHTSPSVFRTRRYLRLLSDTLVGTRKFIVDTAPDAEVIQFNFEEKITPDAFDFGSASLKGRSP